MKIRTTLLIAIAALAAACSNTKQGKSNQKTVAVSIEAQKYFIERIAGGNVNVITLVPKGAKPEAYDLTPKQIIELGNCITYFTMGHLPFEKTWIDKYGDNHPHTNIVNMSHGITPIITDHDHAPQHAFHDEKSKFIDPHTWMSVKNAFTIAKNGYDGLCTADPANKDLYRMRLDTLEKELFELDKTIRDKLAEADSAFLIFHPALTYFASYYGLTQISVERDGKEPSPKEMRRIIDIAERENIKIMFIQPEFDKRSAKTLVEATGVRLIEINPLAYDWKSEMLNIANALASTNDNNNESSISEHK